MENKDIGFNLFCVVYRKTNLDGESVVETVHPDMTPELCDYYEQNGRYVVKANLCLSRSTDASIEELYNRVRAERLSRRGACWWLRLKQTKCPAD